MKHLSSLLLLAISTATATATAQPTIQKNQDYKIGNSFERVNCTGNVQAGAGGANQSWVFTALTPVDTAKTNIIAPAGTPAASTFPDATLVTESNGNFSYIKKTTSDNTLLGGYVSTAGVTTKYNNPVLNARRPFTYNSNVKDTFTVASNAGTGDGIGIIELTGDGYGTLQLPTGTYTNVLRVKMSIKQYDTISLGGTLMPYEINATAYYWLHDGNTSELFRIDTTKISGAFNQTTVTTSYLLKETDPTAIADLSAQRALFSAYFNDRELTVKGAFQNGNVYDIILYNLNGQVLTQKNTSANSDTYTIQTPQDIPAGLYMVTIRERNSGALPTIIKLAKQ